MMSSAIRDELLLQHASLRGRLEAACLAVNRWDRREVVRAHVRDELAGLAEALRSHNLLEEAALRELLPEVDAWGPARLEIMVEAHVREHGDVFDALLAVGETHESRLAVKSVERLRQRLLEHMAREEETFLNTSVLRDDEVVIDAQDG
jgi:hypothetical protein